MLRTKSALHEAINQLALERPLAEITVGDIAGRAGVNRATVYAHYHDRDEILLDALEEQVAAIIEAAAACPISAPADEPERTPVHLVRLFEHLESRRAVFGPLLGPDGSQRLSSGIRHRLADAWRRQIEAAPVSAAPGVPTGVHADFLSGALMGVIQGWLEPADEPRAEPMTVATQIWSLLRSTVPDRAAKAGR